MTTLHYQLSLLHSLPSAGSSKGCAHSSGVSSPVLAMTDIHGGDVQRDMEESDGVMEFQNQSFPKQWVVTFS